MMKAVGPEFEGGRPESWPELHEEIERLPHRYREAIVLCYLEGLTTEEAALRIGCPKGTVLSRLSRARERLRVRLDRRGLATPAVLLATWQTWNATAAPSAILLGATVRASLEFAELRAAEAALASATVTTLARGVLYAMRISKLKVLAAVTRVGTLALGGVPGFVQLGRGSGSQQPATVASDTGDAQAALKRSVDKLEAGLDETARRNAEMQKELQDIRAHLEGLRLTSEATAGKEPVMQLARLLEEHTAQTVRRFADVLKSHPPRRGSIEGDRSQLYMMDLIDGGTTLIADEPVKGLTWSNAAVWSHDGSRILFDASPGMQFVLSRLISLEVQGGLPAFTDLGPGNLPTFSADDKKVAFLLNSGALPDAEDGIWIMEADGSKRRRVGGYGAPFWSRDGRELLVNSFFEPTETTVMNLEQVSEARLEVPGYRTFSVPSWVGPGTIVACIGTKEESDTIALLDVRKPSQARIIEVLWKRGENLDVKPRTPVYHTESRRCFFVGGEPNKRTLYSVKRGELRRAIQVEPEGYNDRLSGLTFSPDGRYLLFGANRPAQPREKMKP
jgi:predicted DNA-binding protein (UPF0251 family)